MKSTLLILCMLLSVCLSAQSYKKRTPEEKATYYTNELKKSIDIDSVQYQKIYAINVEVSKKFDSLYAEKLEEKPRKKAMVGIFKWRDAAFREVLTPTQFLKYDDLQREQYEKRKKEKEEKQKLEGTIK